jgi:cell shape-determining protein MreD
MFIYIILLGIGTLLLQMALPGITLYQGEGFADIARVVLLPLIVVYAALFTRGVALILVVGILGFTADLPSEGRMGLTVVNLAIIATVVVTQQDTRIVRYWYVRVLLVLVCTFFYTFLEYFFYLVQISRFDWPVKVWTHMIVASLINAAACPFAFFLFHIVPRTLGWLRDPNADRSGALDSDSDSSSSTSSSPYGVSGLQHHP